MSLSRFMRQEAEKAAKEFIEELLKPPLLHGDEAHQDWLRAELLKHTGRLADVIELYHEEWAW